MPRFHGLRAAALAKNTALLGLTAATLWVFGCSVSDDSTGPGGPGPGPEVPLQIRSLAPAVNATSAARSGDLIVQFDRPLDAGTVSSADVRAFGRWSGVLAGSVSLIDGDRTLRFSPARLLSAGEWVSATIPAGAIRGYDGAVMSHGFTWTFWIAVTATSMTFDAVGTVAVRNPGEDRIETCGAYSGDLDSDGWLDMIVPNEGSDDLRVFMNDGTGGYGPFTVVPIPEGDGPSPNEGADFDGDGDIDFAVGNAHGSYVAVYHGDGAGGLVHRQNLEAGQGVRGLCVLDFENDGDPDIVAASPDGNHVALFENDGTGAFDSRGTLEAGDGEWACAVGDLNEDGLIDLAIGARFSGELTTWLSNGDGTFEFTDEVSADGDPWMLTSGDLNGDGHVDFAGVNAVEGTLVVYLGDGEGGLFLDQSHVLGDFPLAIDLGDLDGDGDLDAVSSHFQSGLFEVHENIGDGSLVRFPVTLATTGAASCTIFHDRDNDGDLDISGIDELDDVLILFENR